jgi:exo-beta-1,3-glucanase (GH17 family)
MYQLKNYSVILILLMMLAAVSCNNNSEKKSETKTILSMEEIKQKLDAGILIEKESPFAERKFNPYLNGKWIGNAVSYGCYREGQAPGKKGPSEEEVYEDLLIIKEHWNLIRVYNADDDTELILEVIRKHDLPIKVMVGVWLEKEDLTPESGKNNKANVLRGIELANKYSNIIAAISVGNESQVYWSYHKMSQQKLIQYIRTVRNNVTVPVTTADDYNFWNKPESKKVAAEIDFIVAHAYALWNGKTLDNAIEWTEEIFKDLSNIHSAKLITIGETGWATTYDPEKKGQGEQGTLVKGEVSLRAQGKFLIKLNEWVDKNQITTFLFEAFDEPWKGGGAASGPNEIEKHWGVFYVDRSPKESFKNYLKHIEGK